MFKASLDQPGIVKVSLSTARWSLNHLKLFYVKEITILTVVEIKLLFFREDLSANPNLDGIFQHKAITNLLGKANVGFAEVSLSVYTTIVLLCHYHRYPNHPRGCLHTMHYL